MEHNVVNSGTQPAPASDSSFKKQRNYWWFNVNDGWRFDEHTGQEFESAIDENGRLRSNIRKIRTNDLMLGYQSGKSREIVCICSVTKKTDDGFYFKKELDLKNPVSYSSEWKNDDFLKGLLKGLPPRGTLLLLSIEQWNGFMGLIEKENPGFRKQLDDILNGPRNCIYFGAPGTGKSFAVDEKVKNDATAIRTTFHPDSDYASFVGAYKPTMVGDKIAYRFVPQAFTKAYVRAWEKMANCKPDKKPTRQYLVIEEINRGNCAQIFGDLFQLLDRDDNGYSKYPIDPDSDFAEHLKRWFEDSTRKDKEGHDIKAVTEMVGKGRLQEFVSDSTANDNLKNVTWDDILSGRKLVLPPNLYIWATMNTSDQSLFPMDSAFKRRWDWKYSKIKNEGKGYEIEADGQRYNWWEFLQAINAVIRQVTQSADKQLGYFFVTLPNGVTSINAKTFVNKVVFYLWNDVFKDCELADDAFQTEDESKKDSGNTTNAKRQLTFDDFFEDDGRVKEKIVTDFLGNLKVAKAAAEKSGDQS